MALNEVEPFDEWEEFILFASHYFLLVANTRLNDELFPGARGESVAGESVSQSQDFQTAEALSHLQARKCVELKEVAHRRFGALFKTQQCFGLHAGLGTQSRDNITTLFQKKQDHGHGSKTISRGPSQSLPTGIEARMCHTISSSKDGKCLLVGGRVSPDRPLQDCWLFKDGWARVHDLPFALYRHTATWVDFGRNEWLRSGVLVHGGKSANNKISNKWLLWQDSTGWQELKPKIDDLCPTFGSTMTATGTGAGVLIGGMVEDSTLQLTLREWVLVLGEQGQMTLTVTESNIQDPKSSRYLARIGAQVASSDLGIFLVGGASNIILGKQHEVMRLHPPQFAKDNWTLSSVHIEGYAQRMLLVGHNTLATKNHMLVVGGGAVCFSFGTFWNERPIILGHDTKNEPLQLESFQEETSTRSVNDFSTLGVAQESRNHRMTEDAGADEVLVRSYPWCPDDDQIERPTSHRTLQSKNVQPSDLSLRTAFDFSSVLDRGNPVVIRDLDLGRCTSEWNLTALKTRLGPERQVVVHEASSKQMSFLQKNFRYETKTFATFIDEVSEGSPQYLRSLSAENPTGKPANIDNDFPELASDFILPHQLNFVAQNFHSSVLRISGPVDMWLHYDVRIPPSNGQS